VFVLINADGAARGLGTIAVVEVLERLTGTESPWNVRERYAERAKKMKAEGEGIEPAETGIPVLPLSTASRPPGLYEGAFRNPWWGTLTVGRVENGFIMHLGDFPMDIAPAADMPDAFTTSEMFDGPVTGRFVVEANGCIERIVISDPKRGEFEFVR